MNTGQLLGKRFLNLGLSGILSWLYGGYAFGQEYNKSDIEVIFLFSVHHRRELAMSLYLITGDVSLYHLVKEMSARLLKLLFFFPCN